MIPTSIDGTDITGATIDGTDVQEITVDGDTVFEAVPQLPQPDIGHFKADSLGLANGDPVTTWADQSTNGVDVSVSGGTPIIETNSLNGLPGVDMNGGDFQSDSSFSFSQPIVTYVVWEYAGINADENICDGLNDFSIQLRVEDFNELTLSATLGDQLDNNTSLSGPLAIKCVVDGSNSSLQINGTVTTGDVGTDGRQSGYTFGDLNDLRGGTHQSHSTMYEFAEYQNPTAQVQADAEAALSSKWGVTF
jgi:hypothetical protein